jgi:hypothetical protein
MHRILTIVGSAPCMDGDVGAWAPLLEFRHSTVMLVGLSSSAKWRGPAEYIVTYHPNEIPQIKAKRKGKENSIIISHKGYPGVDRVSPHINPSGSSSLLGVRYGLSASYNRIVLCGCPLLGKNGHGRDYNKQYADGWRAALPTIRDEVRSMSGWTKELLGAPTKEWLYGDT